MHRTQDMIAATLAIGGFAAALVAGMAASNAPLGVVARALFAMILCWIVGQLIGKATQTTINEHVALFAASIPVPHIDGVDEIIEVEEVEDAQEDVEEPVDNS